MNSYNSRIQVAYVQLLFYLMFKREPDNDRKAIIRTILRFVTIAALPTPLNREAGFSATRILHKRRLLHKRSFASKHDYVNQHASGIIIAVLDVDALYRAVGRNIRGRREMSPQKLSQQKLADELGISRASIVNIEAGRQHAPLHLLWQIADALGTDVGQFIPKREQLIAAENNPPLDLDQLGLDKEAIRQIKNLVPNPVEQRLLAGFISNKSSTLKTSNQKAQRLPHSGARETK